MLNLYRNYKLRKEREADEIRNHQEKQLKKEELKKYLESFDLKYYEERRLNKIFPEHFNKFNDFTAKEIDAINENLSIYTKSIEFPNNDFKIQISRELYKTIYEVTGGKEHQSLPYLAKFVVDTSKYKYISMDVNDELLKDDKLKGYFFLLMMRTANYLHLHHPHTENVTIETCCKKINEARNYKPEQQEGMGLN